jgi:hypothetical protein
LGTDVGGSRRKAMILFRLSPRTASLASTRVTDFAPAIAMTQGSTSVGRRGFPADIELVVGLRFERVNDVEQAAPAM